MTNNSLNVSAPAAVPYSFMAKVLTEICCVAVIFGQVGLLLADVPKANAIDPGVAAFLNSPAPEAGRISHDVEPWFAVGLTNEAAAKAPEFLRRLRESSANGNLVARGKGSERGHERGQF